MSPRHTQSPDRHVVYCRLTKGKEVKTLTPGIYVNKVPQYPKLSYSSRILFVVWRKERGRKETKKWGEREGKK